MSQPSSSVLSWLQDHAISLQTLDPLAPLDDLAFLEQTVGDATIIGLGEASHGGRECFLMKHRLLRFLVEKMGFTLFAMEMSWMQAEDINEYVVHGTGDARSLLQKNGYGIWYTEEILDLIEWMRAYNADPLHERKVQFAGFDSVIATASGLERIVQYFHLVDPARSSQVAESYQGLSEVSYWNLADLSTRKHWLEAARQVCALLQEKKDAYIVHSSSAVYDAILQEARVAEHAALRIRYAESELDPASEGSLIGAQMRDHFMADNVQWLFEHASGGTKMVLWAHNWHIGTWGEISEGVMQPRPFTWMGMDLRQRYGNSYLTLGFSFFEGTHHAILMNQEGQVVDRERKVYEIEPARTDSYQFVLNQAGSLYLLDLRQIPDGEVKTWLTDPHPFRDFGAEHVAGGGYRDLSLAAWLDLLIEIAQISPSKMLPRI